MYIYIYIASGTCCYTHSKFLQVFSIMSLPTLVNLVYSKLMSKTHRESHIACGRFARNSSRSACLGKL